MNDDEFYARSAETGRSLLRMEQKRRREAEEENEQLRDLLSAATDQDAIADIVAAAADGIRYVPPRCTHCGRQLGLLRRFDGPEPIVRYEPTCGCPAMNEARAFLGKRVEVVLDQEEPPTIARGQLLSISDSGEIVVRDEMGFCHWCWPMLEIHVIDDD